MFTLTGFADEISPDLKVQLDVFESLGIKYVELRGVWDKNVLALSDSEVETIKAEMDKRGIGVSAIGSPIGKIKIDDPFEPHVEDFRRALKVAEFFGCEYIRMFSFYVPAGQADAYRDQVMERLAALLEEAKGHPVVMLHENESDIYGDIPRRCLDIMETFASAQLRTTFDPANYVMNDVHPFTDGYDMLKDYIDYLHVKDGLMADKSVVPAGQGDGQIRELLRALESRGFAGFASLEPHLAHSGAMRGFSGPELFKVAADALKGLLAEVGAQVS